MYKIPLSILMLISLYACNGFLDDVEPKDELLLTELFRTGEDLEAALIGAYDIIQNGQNMGGNIPALADVMSGNAEGWFLPASTLQMEASYWMTEELWTGCYRAINQTNAILNALPEVLTSDASFSPDLAKQIEGEARFIRGVLYFEMVRLYALPYATEHLGKPGVPIVLEPVLDQSQLTFPARAGVEEVYQQAESDLSTARDLLPEANTDGRATKYAALAYLAEIAFQKGEYSQVVVLTSEIIGAGKFQLTPEPQDFFREEGSAEEIWVIKGSINNDPISGGLASVYNDAPTTAHISQDLREKGYASLLTPQIKQTLEDQNLTFVDLRMDPDNLFSDGDLLVLSDSTRCNKYEHSWTSGEDDTPVIRLAEILLMRAEALARILGVNQESIDLLNQVRQRSIRVLDEFSFLVPQSDELISFSLQDFPDPDELIEAIIRERRVELAFEGNYFHDLMRLKRDVLNNGSVYPFDAPELRLPIPQREIDANPNLEQNP